METDRENSDLFIRGFFRAHRQGMEALFSDIPLLNPAQHFMLGAIQHSTDSGKRPSQRELARDMQLSPATVTATLRSLETQGLVRRTADETDQRVNRVELTPRGLSLTGECHRRMEQLEDGMLRGFSPEEIRQLSGYLNRMSENLTHLGPARKEEQ